ncbi:Putative E3 ubiquitin-protein ligase UBR7 [Linum perenne]
MLCTSPPLFRPHFLHKMIFRKKTTILMVQVLVSDKAGDIGSPVLKGGTINALLKHQRSFICGSTSVQVKSKIPEEIWLEERSGKEVIKAISGEGDPLNNFVYFDIVNWKGSSSEKIGRSGVVISVKKLHYLVEKMADAFDDENDRTVTMDEYLKEVEAEELEADLVLGGDEGKECTYNTGYMKRQAIFSCLTCTPEGNAGVCTACSLSCHDGHEIVELWTKRNFRCDCGNSKFGVFFCKLCPSKDVENVENSYNHNFKGHYCTCGRPYPDPVAEDWFHEEHLGLESLNEIPRDNDGEPIYEDFICKACSTVCSFLVLYPRTVHALRCQSGVPTSNTSKDKSVVESDPPRSVNGDVDNNVCSGSSGNCGTMTSPNHVLVEIGSSSNGNLEPKNCPSICAKACVLESEPAISPLNAESKPLFLAKDWREKLCRCEKCLELYKQKRIGYLIDKEDSIAEYETKAKQKREEKLQKQEDVELDLFNNLGHVEKIEILNGIADFKDELRSFLESFDPSKIITSSDVHQYFENLAKKRRRM